MVSWSSTIKIQRTWNHWGRPHSTFWGGGNSFTSTLFAFVLCSGLLVFWETLLAQRRCCFTGRGRAKGKRAGPSPPDPHMCQSERVGAALRADHPVAWRTRRVFRILDLSCPQQLPVSRLNEALKGLRRVNTPQAELLLFCRGGRVFDPTHSFCLVLDRKRAARRADVYV